MAVGLGPTPPPRIGAQWRLVQSLLIGRSGALLFARRGDVIRVTDVEGGQSGDLNAFSWPGLNERFSAGRTRTMSGIHPSAGHYLWSAPPHDRRMFTIVEDTVGANDVLFPRCSSLRYDEVGLPGHPNCQDILATTIRPIGLSEDDVHDSFNMFMRTELDEQGRPRILEPPSAPGGFITLECHLACVVAISRCPNTAKYGRPSAPLLTELLRQARR